MSLFLNLSHIVFTCDNDKKRQYHCPLKDIYQQYCKRQSFEEKIQTTSQSSNHLLCLDTIISSKHILYSLCLSHFMSIWQKNIIEKTIENDTPKVFSNLSTTSINCHVFYINNCKYIRAFTATFNLQTTTMKTLLVLTSFLLGK